MRLYTTLLTVISILMIAPAGSEASPIAAADSTARAAAGVAPTDSVSTDVETLDEFVVTAKKKLVESDGAKLTYNVTEDPQAQSSPVMDILRKVPGVSVDAEDNIKVNGQSSFKIFLNGREDPTMQGDVKQILKAMPASSIKKIEVISDPGAKYEAEGTGGILNIVTITRQRLEGFMVNTNLWGGNNGIGTYVSARTKVRNVTADLSVSYNNGHLFHRYATSRNETDNLQATEPGELFRRSTHKRLRMNNYDYCSMRLNMSWEPDTVNLFTLSGNYNINNWSNPFNETTVGTDINGSRLWSYMRSTFKQDGNWHGGSIMGSYQHTFGAEGAHNIVFSYSYSNNGDNSDFLMNTHDIENYDDIDYIYTRSLSKGFSDTHIVQIDYANPFAKWITFEAGAKGTFFRNHNHSEGLYGMTPDDLAPREGTDSRANQFRDIMAAYVSANISYKRLKSRVGLRYEHTHMGMKYPDGYATDFSTNLNDLVPNASVTYNLTDASNMRLAYQLRISRPSLWVLNPYVNRMTEGEIRYGNPNLKSEKMHRITLSYSNYDHPLTGEVKLNYMYESNSITDIIFMYDGILNTTYANVGKSQNLELEANLSWSPVTDLNLNFYYSITRNWLKADSELLHRSKQYWQDNVTFSADYKFPCKIRLSGWAGYWSPWQDLQSKGQSGYYYGLGISRSFLKEDALTVGMNVNTLFPIYRENTYTQRSATVETRNTFRYPQWYFGASVSYRFGGLKAQVKKTAASIEADSEAGSSSKGK